jgi:hypothetical protein
MNIEGYNPTQTHPKTMKSGVATYLRSSYDRLDCSHQKFRTWVEDGGNTGARNTQPERRQRNSGQLEDINFEDKGTGNVRPERAGVVLRWILRIGIVGGFLLQGEVCDVKRNGGKSQRRSHHRHRMDTEFGRSIVGSRRTMVLGMDGFG